MGQSQSASAAEDQRSPTTATSPSTENSAQTPSLDSLIAEAAAYGDEDNSQSLEAKAQRALECPCIAHLRSGPCGVQFSDAFVCFLKSTAEEKGSDCVPPFVALQKCIKANPDAFSKDVLEDEEEVKKEEKPTPDYRIRPPLWSGQSKTPTHKL
ncbi:Cox19-like CHCH family protein [Perilla frutescens var. hirtella]|uniref:Mitochondrial intermembrane space import and assembly protein 40 homolog n=1 Tax=Perilla frutescens var. hirtella TaxID=608512 RepID=A0AAD4IZC3_PERFH|nr:Cox19-like CHCH family protein [Perilla frutescens var. hirtella]